MYKGKYYRRNLVELENRVKAIRSSDDPLNVDLYEAIRELSEGILVLKNLAYNVDEIDIISHMVAIEIYSRLQSDKNFEVYAWSKYVKLRTLGVRDKYLKSTKRVAVTTKDILDSQEVQRLIFSSAKSLATVDSVNYRRLSETIQDIPDKIKYLYNQLSRYRKGTRVYDDVYISVLLTMNNSGLCMSNLDLSEVRLYGNLAPRRFKRYVRFLVLAIYHNLREWICRNCDIEDFDISTVLSDFAVDNLDLDYDSR